MGVNSISTPSGTCWRVGFHPLEVNRLHQISREEISLDQRMCHRLVQINIFPYYTAVVSVTRLENFEAWDARGHISDVSVDPLLGPL